MEFLKRTTADLPNVEVESFGGLLADYAKQKNACAIVKGLRAVSDFEYEFQMALANRKLNPELDTVFLMTSAEYMYLSSSIVKDIAVRRRCRRFCSLRGLCRTLCAELERRVKMATLEELINRMYDMVQDAKGIPLAGEKCIVERDHMLDMLDELREALPNDLQQAQEIVAKRSEMLASGKREAEAIRRQAEEDARQMVSETEIVVAARRKRQGSTGQCRDSGS